jgi:hypothetical protein
MCCRHEIFKRGSTNNKDNHSNANPANLNAKGPKLRLSRVGGWGWGWVVGSSENKANSAQLNWGLG